MSDTFIDKMNFHQQTILFTFGKVVNYFYDRSCLFRIDLILGRQGSKSKDVYESKQSLASRIVNTERQV